MKLNSRKTLHLRGERSLDTIAVVRDTPSAQISNSEDASSTSPGFGAKSRVIQIRYRCGKAVTPAVAATAVDMRTKCFLSTGMQMFD